MDSAQQGYENEVDCEVHASSYCDFIRLQYLLLGSEKHYYSRNERSYIFYTESNLE